MNSKSEWGGFKMPRLTVEPSEHEKLKIAAAENEKAKIEAEALTKFRDKNINFVPNRLVHCRKREEATTTKMHDSAASNAKKLKDDDKCDVTDRALSYTSARGVWNPDPSRFLQKKSKKQAKSQSTPTRNSRLLNWLNDAKTSTPAKVETVCDKTFVIESAQDGPTV